LVGGFTHQGSKKLIISLVFVAVNELGDTSMICVIEAFINEFSSDSKQLIESRSLKQYLGVVAKLRTLC
jgi:hypothetical protein